VAPDGIVEPVKVAAIGPGSLLAGVSAGPKRRAGAISTMRGCLRSAELFYEPSGPSPLGNNNGCSFISRAHRAPVGRCARQRLRARPPPDPNHRGVTFLNGRTSAISKWWTQLMSAQDRNVTGRAK
jgi:hypothetical protein